MKKENIPEHIVKMVLYTLKNSILNDPKFDLKEFDPENVRVIPMEDKDGNMIAYIVESISKTTKQRLWGFEFKFLPDF